MMLKPEQAKERLAQWRLPEDENRLVAEVSRLPRALAELATEAFQLSRDDEPTRYPTRYIDWREQQARQKRAAMELDRQSTVKRGKVFEVIAPQLAPAMEQTWQLLKTAPYQSGYVQKAFRAPQHPHLAASNLGSWLEGVGGIAARYPAKVLTPTWLAAWAPYLNENHHYINPHLGPLLAGVLNQDDELADEVFEILRQSLNNQHEIGAPGRHVYTAFLLSSRPEAWDLVEKTLLAAQRQEGLRQAILETVDLTHPEAFRRMLRLILEHDLCRFSAVIRAVDVWFGQLWAAASAGVVKKMLTRVVEFCEDDSARKTALDGEDAETAFLALWCEAADDAVATVPLAARLLKAKSAELRYVATRHLVNLDMADAEAAVVPAIDDADLRVAFLAMLSRRFGENLPPGADSRFERIERLVARAPEKPQTLKSIVWPWTEMTVERSQAAACLIDSLGQRPATRLIPYLPMLEPHYRRVAVERLVEGDSWDSATHQAIVRLAGDASPDVRAVCFAALDQRGVRPEDVSPLEGYLTRKSSDLRRGVLAILMQQDDGAALESSRRLIESKNANQRLAGLELLRLLSDAQRCMTQCRETATAYQANRKKISNEEKAHLAEIAKVKGSVATLDNALGLMDLTERTPVVAPRNLKTPFFTASACGCLESLDELVHEHREASITYRHYMGEMQEGMLGAIGWGFPGPDYARPRDGQQPPLADVWLKWNAGRAEKLRDPDGLELLRAETWCAFTNGWRYSQWESWAAASAARRKLAAALSGGKSPRGFRYPHVVSEVVDWLLFLAPPDGSDYLLDVLETAYALVPAGDLAKLTEPREQQTGPIYYGEQDESDWREISAFQIWSKAFTRHLERSGQTATLEQFIRYWRLMHWRDQPLPRARRHRVEEHLILTAYELEAATLVDVADHLLGPREANRYGGGGFDLLSALTARKRTRENEALLAERPELRDLVDRAVARILELELTRGDSPTAATAPAHSIGALSGIATLRRILQAIGQAKFKVGSSWRVGALEDRLETLTSLAKITYPADDEGVADFERIMKAAVRAGEFPQERLLQLVFLAPQWTKHVEAYLGWPQMSEGVFWFLAHMRYIGGLGENAAEAAGVDEDEDQPESEGDGASAPDESQKLSAWQRLILERTPLTDMDRNEGAIDVAWFGRTHQVLGGKRWQSLASAARFASNAAQAKRAQFIADVLQNKVKRNELITGIKKKQLKDHVRLLGLLPLAKGAKRQADLLERCRILREYRRYANQLSGLTKPAALRAWEIGMKNLAQMAGYADPLRLEWAVGADAVQDLARRPVQASKDGVTVTLALDDLATPEISVRRGDKDLKSIPPAIKKDTRIVALTGRVTELKRQAAAMRQSLETAMCRGDQFTGDELRQWHEHALLVPLLARLVIAGDGILGYPDKGGRALRDFSGKLEPVKQREELRIAHPFDLLETGHWHNWQRECFQAERVQPFKQVFRELYVVTKQEKKDGAISHRYDGQQIQPQQALALFGHRGWNTRDGVFKVFHDAELTAHVGFDYGFTTPLEVEGATLAGVNFTRHNDWQPVPTESVPPRLFSEVMRDLDLVVSVAHAGGVDPEASASTIEMRAGLLRETCSLLKLKNVRLKPTHAVIDGDLASYSIHLGSGVVHKMPGGSLCIVPVHAQHRGRLFLPFADDDPRTAEVVSKVLLLARDAEIQDPTILEQIRR